MNWKWILRTAAEKRQEGVEATIEEAKAARDVAEKALRKNGAVIVFRGVVSTEMRPEKIIHVNRWQKWGNTHGGDLDGQALPLAEDPEDYKKTTIRIGSQPYVIFRHSSISVEEAIARETTKRNRIN